MQTQTLCWDCAKACGGCSWSANGKPVKGWLAMGRMIRDVHGAYTWQSYMVISCPKFKRDAWSGGQRRLREGPPRRRQRRIILREG